MCPGFYYRKSGVPGIPAEGVDSELSLSRVIGNGSVPFMKILITGAAGFVGSHVAERCRALGHEVMGVDSFDPYYSPDLKRATGERLRAAGVTMEEADLKTADLGPILDGTEVVFHLAAQPGNTEGMSLDRYSGNNLFATHRLVEACAGSPALRHFVNIATSSIYGFEATGPESVAPQPVSHYGVTKLAAEQLVLARHRVHGFPACSLRLFSVYGERERPDKLYPKVIKALFNEIEFPLFQGSENHLRSYTYVGDIVDGMLGVLNHWEAAAGEIFNIGTDHAITTGEGIALLEEITGKKARIRHLPPRSGDQLKTHANIDKARERIGYNPTTSPREGLTRMVRWYREEIHGKVDY